MHLPQNWTCGILNWFLFSSPLGAGWNWAQPVHRGYLVHTHQGGVVLPGGNPQTGGGGTEPPAGLQRGIGPAVLLSVKCKFGLRKKQTNKNLIGQFCLGKRCALQCSESWIKAILVKQRKWEVLGWPCRAVWAHSSWWQWAGVTLGWFLNFSS